MNKQHRLIFLKSELNQCNYIMGDNDISSKVSMFLLKYVSVEAFYKKLLIVEKESKGRKLTQSEKRKLKVVSSDVERVLSYFNIAFQEDLIERIFGSIDSNYMNCSIKKLRDRLVHSVNENVLRIILERYEQIDRDLKEFLSLFNV